MAKSTSQAQLPSRGMVTIVARLAISKTEAVPVTGAGYAEKV